MNIRYSAKVSRVEPRTWDTSRFISQSGSWCLDPCCYLYAAPSRVFIKVL